MSIKKIIASTITISLFTASTLALTANAEPNAKSTTKEDVKYVSLSNIAAKNNGRVSNPTPDSVEYKIKDTSIKLNFDSPFMNIGGNIVPLENTEINGIKVPNFDAKFKRNDKNQIIVPLDLIKDPLKLNADNINTEEEDTSKEDEESAKEETTKKPTNSNTESTRPNNNNNNNNNNRPSNNTTNNNSSNNSSSGNNNNSNSNNNSNNTTETKPESNGNADSNNDNNTNTESENTDSNNNSNSGNESEKPKPDTSNPEPDTSNPEPEKPTPEVQAPPVSGAEAVPHEVEAN